VCPCVVFMWPFISQKKNHKQKLNKNMSRKQ
jgi:hypothetical protein